jgi:primosomal protein N' (replication factor Y)
VAGRAGRKGTKGEVWIQTFDTQNKVRQMVQNHDYHSLYQQQIAEREMFNYPPFYRIIRLQMKDHNALRVQDLAVQLQQHLVKIFGNRVSAVIVPSIERVQAYTLRELTLRIENRANMTEAKRRIKEAIDYICSIPSNKNSKIIVDVDPQ